MKKLLLILLCLPMIGFGQEWIKEYYFAGAPEGDWDDTPINVQQTSDNGFMIFSADLIKTNIYGDTIWTKDIGHPEDGGDGIQTSDGGYLAISGDSLSRFDSLGNLIWQKDVYFNAHRGINTLDDGFTFIANSWYIHKSDDYPYLVRTNSIGDTLWTKRYTEGYIFESLYQTQDSSFFITGRNSSDAFLMKVNSTGDSIWTETFGLFNEGAGGNFITQTSDGGFIITGTVEENGCDKVLLLKTDISGNLTWSKTISSSFCEDIGYFVQQTTDGGYIITGDIWLANEDTKMWLIKTDMNGDTLWTRQFGNPYGNGKSVRQTNDGGYIITGHFYQNQFSVAVVLIKTNASGLVTEIRELTTSTNSKLIQITDLLGRETKKTNQPLLYIYDDGTVEKRIVVE